MLGIDQTLEERVREVADELAGTCKSLHEVATEDERNDLTFCQELDDQVLECTSCGWWFRTEENTARDGEQPLCGDCEES